jgi:hypothetical protein
VNSPNPIEAISSRLPTSTITRLGAPAALPPPVFGAARGGAGVRDAAEPLGRAEAGLLGRAEAGLLGRAEAVLLGRTEAVVPGRTEADVLGRADVEVLGRADVEVLGRADVEVLGRADVEVLGREAVEVPGRAEPVVPDRVGVVRGLVAEPVVARPVAVADEEVAVGRWVGVAVPGLSSSPSCATQ